MKITQERLAEIEFAPREAYITKAEAKALADAYRGLDELVMALHYVKNSVFEDSAAFEIAKTALTKVGGE